MKNRLKILGNRTIGILTILTLLTYIFINFVYQNKTYAAQENATYDANRISKYPGYKELIENLKTAHPNWNFVIFYTGLDWNTVIQKETTERHGRNLITSSKTSDWFCTTCKDKPYDNGSWRCASEQTVSYYMDPRNFLNDSEIFQFEQSIFNSSIHSSDGVMNMTAGSFLEGRANADAIIQACQNVNINPYQVVARILQEQGKTGTTMSRGNEGYYNVFNVGASGDTSAEIIRNATQYAREHGWNTLAKSILGGIDFLKSKYIGQGQDTLYLQKFDVDDNGSLYYHQYMQNVSAALTESYTVRNIYQKMGTFNGSVTFRIPVYENMPSTTCQAPTSNTIVTQNVIIKGSSVRIRSSETTATESNIIATVNAGYQLLRIEIAKNTSSGIYWDKVVLPDGRKGYVSHSYLTQVEDITNCNEAVMTTTEVYLRNGPGTENTTTIELLPKGQYIRRIEKNKYNVDGYVWDRVILPNGTQGYVAQKYLECVEPNNKFKLENDKLICEPDTQIETIREKNANNAVEVKNLKGEVVNSGNVGTGYTVTINSKAYKVIKLGDVNGDGLIKTVDYMKIKNHIMNIDTLTDYNLQAADTNKDGKISTIDYMMIKNKMMSISNIEL